MTAKGPGDSPVAIRWLGAISWIAIAVGVLGVGLAIAAVFVEPMPLWPAITAGIPATILGVGAHITYRRLRQQA